MRISFKWQWAVLSFLVLHTAVAHSGRDIQAVRYAGVKGGGDILVAQARQYEHGEGVLQDREKAVELYCQAARQGSAEGQYALGWMYANGRGVERNDGIAARLFEMAAARKHADAQKLLRFMPLPDKRKVQLPNCLSRNVYVRTNITPNKYYVDQSISALVEKLAPQYEIDPGLVLAVIAVESGFNTQAVSPKNAQGLMQLIPATAERFQVRDVFDPEENIRGGMAYLRWLLAFFKGDVALVAAAYNAGEGAVEKYRGIPPYPETVKYVDKIMSRYNKTSHPYQPGVVNRTSFIFASAASGQ
ncbi:MAG TPA: transglycosylase SLT domain-containing protein [Nitrosomonas europaea]|uniref:SLT domain n=1 Tax=Nitrosomonas europaea (strain ATCC 19718 / CIP 103999 / KCTC 2705 / NBRC 14298) TaxID=228410 RepID=Q82SS9_NITEU|nr:MULTISPECIES: transglycosylase SLT domain-containing protein [Nitrosomonas]CAD86138.1 SLT domain [Nitrosomonas europaea ATCC 19718]SDW83388.1 Sel1 repeat-containing protein [Nitrosomonas europaea]SET37335.1 Sel1 repeat-containing protein [Nitrosomonas europaea]SJZ92718.1 Sel1 repeat-containing protein [Nitrosomonas europaea]HBF24043.1 lytic transglycosylase [Nitrosomonas sp.]